MTIGQTGDVINFGRRQIFAGAKLRIWWASWN